MSLRAFTTLDQLRSSPFDLPSTLMATAEERHARSEAWAAFHFQTGGQEIWTLVLPEDRSALQWRDGERYVGEWVEERRAVKLEEGREWGLYSLEGRLVPSDAADDEEEGDSYSPVFGRKPQGDAE